MRQALAVLALALVGLLSAGPVEAASIGLRRQGGASLFTAKVGEQVDMEVVIEAGEEEVTGFTFFLSFDPRLFRLLPASQDELGQPQPFAAGGWLQGIALLDRVEQIEGETFLEYVEAAGVQRHSATGTGVAARFRLEVLRRPAGAEGASIRVEERGHDRVSHYVTAAAPGVEQRFTPPLGLATAQVLGFRILPLPNLELVTGEERMVFDLDEYVDQPGVQVIWTASRLPEIPTAIDPQTNQVTMRPQETFHGEGRMVFTAFETGEGLTVSDTITIAVFARPHIHDFPDSVVFEEDKSDQSLDLDAFVTDLDDLPSALDWTPSGGGQVQVQVDPSSHIALFRAAPDWSGQEEIHFTVADAHGLQDTASTLVVVLPVDDPPQAFRIAPVYPVQGGPQIRVPLSRLVQDVDDAPDRLAYTLQVEGGIEAEVAGDGLMIRGLQAGRGVVHFTARDSSGGQASERLVAVVLPPAGTVRPLIRPLPELRFTSGRVGTMDLGAWVEDDSPDSLLSWTAIPGDSLGVRVEQGSLVVNAERGFAGNSFAILQVTDPDGNQDQAVLAVQVLPPGEDAGPQILAPGKVGVVVGGQTRLPLDQMAVDPEYNTAVLQWTFQTSGGLEANLDPDTRTLTLTAPAGLSAPGSLVLTATDPAGHTAEAAVPVLAALPGGSPRLRAFDDVVLDSLDAQARVNLDDFAFDAEDAESELLWTVQAEPGVQVSLDPAHHTLNLRRTETDGPPPESSQVLLRVLDTAGQETTAFLQVELPPVFSLRELPAISFYAGQVDTSLVLDEYISFQGRPLQITWSVNPPQNLDAPIDSSTHRVRLQAKDPAFQGSETLAFTARDATGRTRVATVRVTVKGRGLTPQIRPLPVIQMQVGDVDTSLHLDEYVVDDDPDSLLQWVASGAQSLKVAIDPVTRVVELRADAAVPGVEQVQLLVRDPAGNTALQTLQVQVRRGGAAPQIRSLPRVILVAGGDEERLELDAFASDADTPLDSLSWGMSAEPGVSARLEGHQLFLAVPAGQDGIRQVRLQVADPQGNQATAVLQIVIQTDNEAPRFTLAVRRNLLFTDLLELEVRPSEPLREAPQVLVGGQALQVELQDDGSFLAFYQVPVAAGEQQAEVVVRGTDLAGNQGQRRMLLALRWMDEGGGSLREPGGQVWLNVPDAAAGPGRLALLRRLDQAEVPADSAGQAVYEAGLMRGQELPHPVTVCFAMPDTGGADWGILRWDETSGQWEELPTMADQARGQLSASVDRLGLFRLGPVSAQNRRPSQWLSSFPNPFPTKTAAAVQIAYQVYVPGSVQLEVFDILGQRVRRLVDSPFQDLGAWTAWWDGRDESGQAVSSGLYFGQLRANGRIYCVKMTLQR